MKSKSKTKLTILTADKIVIPAYMQNPSTKIIDLNEVKSLNPNKINPLLVSYRNNKYYVIDGQNTLCALCRLYGDKVVIPTIVIQGLTYEQEALLYMHETTLSELGCI